MWLKCLAEHSSLNVTQLFRNCDHPTLHVDNFFVDCLQIAFVFKDLTWPPGLKSEATVWF